MRRSRVALAVNALVTLALATVTALTWPQEGTPRMVDAPYRSDGEALFVAKGCAVCHAGPDGTGEGITGVGLVNVQSRVPGMSREEYIRESIARPGAFVTASSAGSSAMPALALSEGEVERLVRFLISET